MNANRFPAAAIIQFPTERAEAVTARILPEDVAARMAQTFADMQRGTNAMAAEWRPQEGRDFNVAVVPKAARSAIEQALQQAGLPVTEDAITEVYRAFLEGQRQLRDPGAAGP